MQLPSACSPLGAYHEAVSTMRLVSEGAMHEVNNGQEHTAVACAMHTGWVYKRFSFRLLAVPIFSFSSS
jgi:hypothetical protein